MRGIRGVGLITAASLEPQGCRTRETYPGWPGELPLGLPLSLAIQAGMPLEEILELLLRVES